MIRIHRFENENWGRYHLPWMKYFSEYLKQFFDVEIINYNKDGKTFSGNIVLQTEIPKFKNNPPLSDTDCVYENLETGEFVLTTFTNSFNSRVVHYLRSEKCNGIISAHFSRRHIYDILKKDNILEKINIVYPWIFGFFKEFDVDNYRNIRDKKENLNNKLFFKGGGWKGEKPYRSVINVLYNKNFLNPNPVPFDMYLNELSTQEIGISYCWDVDVSLNYYAEVCYRDIEMMSIGVPFIRIEYKCNLHNAFIPNYHYITIPRESAFLRFENHGNEGVADLIIEKYEEVKNNKSFLKFISKNQREWFDINMRWPKSGELAFKKLNFNKWIK